MILRSAPLAAPPARPAVASRRAAGGTVETGRRADHRHSFPVHSPHLTHHYHKYISSFPNSHFLIPLVKTSPAKPSQVMSRDMKNKCLFGSQSHWLAVSADNRLRLWDVSRAKEARCFVEKQHLAHSYTCFAWGRDETKGGLGVCAVGTSDGKAIVWDLARGVVVRTIASAGGAAAPAVADLCFSSDLSSLFVCSSDSNIFEYSIGTGETEQVLKGFKKGAVCLATSQKYVAAAR